MYLFNILFQQGEGEPVCAEEQEQGLVASQPADKGLLASQPAMGR